MRGALSSGDRVLLKYWNGTEYVDEIPAGVSIGFWLEGMGFNQNNGNVGYHNSTYRSRFSTKALNPSGEQYSVAFMNKTNTNIVAASFEDNLDMRYNDATFYIYSD